MRRPRLTTRRWIVAVALVATVLGTAVADQRLTRDAAGGVNQLAQRLDGRIRTGDTVASDRTQEAARGPIGRSGFAAEWRERSERRSRA
jgi:hypothetical protein